MIRQLLLVSLIMTSIHTVAADDKKCDAEFKKFCDGKSNKKEQGECIKKNFSHFSKDCRSEILPKSFEKKEVSDKCTDEVVRVCESVDSNCYKKNRGKISIGCQGQLDEIIPVAGQDVIGNCMDDFDRLCPFPADFDKDNMGQAKYNECIFKNLANFSKNCLEAMGMDKDKLENLDKTKVIKKEKR